MNGSQYALVPFQPGSEWGARASPCGRSALAYARDARLPVFPVNGKEPLSRRGFKDATTESAIIRAWWRKWPSANIGIPTGVASGWLVLDIDEKSGGYDSLHLFETMARHRAADEHRLFDPWPLTRTALTGGGGLHLVYAYPTELDAPITNKVEVAGLGGIDLRGEGGFIVVAPSLHANGRRYVWSNEMAPAPMPALLGELLQLHLRRKPLVRDVAQAGHHLPGPASRSRLGGVGKSDRRARGDYWLTLALRGVARGNRHSKALFLACRLIEFGVVQPEHVMREFVRSVPGGGEDYPLSDALKCLEWAEHTIVPARRGNGD